MNWTAAIASFAVLTTFLSPVLILKLTSRSQRNAKLDDLRMVLYTEATIYVQTLASMLNQITDADSSYVAQPGLTHADVLTARMRLIASPEILAAWQQIVLQWNVEEDYSGLNHRPDNAVDSDYNPAVFGLCSSGGEVLCRDSERVSRAGRVTTSNTWKVAGLRTQQLHDVIE